ncbi:hypothetical protein BDN72DRAFT_905040 [Pluteus cervinus]|uniref:Uncharacterized protein n=1 Tax=Pluteus cervinus TaxID=181527 RepID=A0ACD3A3S3_9AGAR|nr:hypothetical protein BDN72DRAFT_905040 [Pluteus cervinus]
MTGPADIVPETLTHLLYAFAVTDGTSGTIQLTKYGADVKSLSVGDTNEPGTNLYGCLKQMYLLKLRQRNLKVLLAIGGSTSSERGDFNFVINPSARATFVESAVEFVEDYGFDGIDIDYEYPANEAQGQGLADLVTALRSAFTVLQQRKRDSEPYQITVAVGAGPTGYNFLKIPQMDAAIDYWNLMAYDFTVSTSTHSDHHANLYGGIRTSVSGHSAVELYVLRGATPSKINLGMPLYGYEFQETDGLRQPHNRHGKTVGYKDLPSMHLPLSTSSPKILTESPSYSLSEENAKVFTDTADVASHSYDSSTRELITYDTAEITRTKSQYIINNGLAGSMFWELSTDKLGGDSLVGTAAAIFGTLDPTQNHISYPNSKYENLRRNLGPRPPSAWIRDFQYSPGYPVLHCDHLWTAKCFTEGNQPGGTSNAWEDKGPSPA